MNQLTSFFAMKFSLQNNIDVHANCTEIASFWVPLLSENRSQTNECKLINYGPGNLSLTLWIP